MNEQGRKFLAFEWLMFVILGLFWGVAMFLPLFLSKSLADKAAFWKNFFIITGPYLIYAVTRLIFLLYRSFRWAYLVSNLLFTSEQERRFADEWAFFLFLMILWSAVIAYPLYVAELLFPEFSPAAVIVMIGPYCVFMAIRGLWQVTIRALNTNGIKIVRGGFVQIRYK